MILLMGVAPLAQVGGLVWKSKAPYWARLGGTWLCVALAIACVGAAFMGFSEARKKRKAEAAKRRRPKKVFGPKPAPADAGVSASAEAADSAARPASADDPPSRAGS